MTHFKTDYAIINAELVVDKTSSQANNNAEGILHKAGLIIQQGKIQEIFADSTEAQAQAQKLGLEIIDAQGAYLGPGLIDIHIHGCGGTDTGQEDLQSALETMAQFLAQRGITSFQPAVFPSVEVMAKAQAALEASPLAAYHVCSIYNEGPFIALEKKGGLPAESLRDFTAEYKIGRAHV